MSRRDSKTCIHRAAGSLSCGQPVKRRVEDLDPRRGSTAAGLQRGEELGQRLFAIPWEQATGQGFTNEILVGTLRRVPGKPDQVPRTQGAPPISRPAKERSTRVPSLVKTPACGYERRIVQLHPRDAPNHIRGQLRHPTAAAEEVPAVEHDAEVPKPARFDHRYRGAEVWNGTPWKELEVDR